MGNFVDALRSVSGKPRSTSALRRKAYGEFLRLSGAGASPRGDRSTLRMLFRARGASQSQWCRLNRIYRFDIVTDYCS
jgi:hypothetical protein